MNISLEQYLNHDLEQDISLYTEQSTGSGADTGSTTTNDKKGNENQLGSIILMGVMVVGIIGLFVWQTISGKKKQKEAQNMVNSLKIGDRVKTIGGICGFVVEINDAENTFVLETGSSSVKNYVKFDKGAIYQTAPAQGNAVEAPKSTEEKKETTEEKK